MLENNPGKAPMEIWKLAFETYI